MQLNNEQKQAVQHCEGPVLIIAGAGTGKTRVITEKILDLINSGKAKPGEILALTFTDKAANEMLERVDQQMPLGYEEIAIKTFHSFSEHILREYGLEMGIDPGYTILPKVEQWCFLKKHLFEFNLDYYRPLGNPNKFIYAILTHFSRLKDELIKPEKYLEYASDLEGEEGEKMVEIARAYAKYQELLLANNAFDFGDLTYYALELLEKRSSILKELQELYKYILVDEFQDTNYAQFQLVLRLAEEHKNLTVVGDDDQSIYKWRGASLSNILQFEDHFPNAQKIVLVENYRSGKSILDGAYYLIQNNNPDRLEERSGINKQLHCNVSIDSPIKVHHFPNFIQESVFVAERIRDLHEKNAVSYGDIAILVRTNQVTHAFIDELKYLGIPYQVRDPKGLMGLDEIKDLIAVTRFIANPHDDISLLRILKMDVFDVRMEEIVEVLHNPAKENLFRVILNGDDSLPGLESAPKKVGNLLMELIEFSRNKGVGLVLTEFLRKSGQINFLVENEKFEGIANIDDFAKQVAKFEKSTPDNSISDFVDYLNLLEEANAPLASGAFDDRDAVQILTVHGAKGLEFDYVFIGNMVNQRFPSTNRREALEIPVELTSEILPEGDVHIQEERRLFYVAMTRARKELVITYSDQYEGNKKWKPSVFVNEVVESGGVEVVNHDEKEDFVDKLKKFREPKKPIFDLPPFKSKRLSYSQLNTFKTCPLKYSYQYMMKVPVPSSHAANFGSSVHDTLNEFYGYLKNGKEVSFGLMEKLYEKHWIPYGYENKAHENTRKKKGLETLKQFFEKNCDPWVIPMFLERNFHVKIGDFSLSGRIDRIDKLEDGTYEVIDYKTGQLKNDVRLDKDLQLSIYALACRDVFGLKVSKLSLYFLEDNEKMSTSRNDEQIDEVRAEVEALTVKMKESDFSPTPGFICQFCDFRLICPAV